MEMSVGQKIWRSLWIAFCLMVGIFTIILNSLDFEKSVGFLGIFLIIEALPHIYQTFSIKEHKIMFSNMTVISLIGIALGLWAYFSRILSIGTACIIYGSYNIFRGVYETINSHQLAKIKKSKIPYFDIVLSIGDIIFAILLIIRQRDGIPGHLYYLGVSFIAMSVMETIDYLYER